MFLFTDFKVNGPTQHIQCIYIYIVQHIVYSLHNCSNMVNIINIYYIFKYLHDNVILYVYIIYVDLSLRSVPSHRPGARAQSLERALPTPEAPQLALTSLAQEIHRHRFDVMTKHMPLNFAPEHARNGIECNTWPRQSSFSTT